MKRKQTSKTKKPLKTKAVLKKECLALWSMAVRTRDRQCRICGSDQVLQGHHIRSVRNQATMLDLQNGMALCARCHCLQRFSPEKFQDNIIDVIGQREYDRLRVRSQQVFSYTAKDLDMMRTHLQGVLKSLEQDMGRL